MFVGKVVPRFTSKTKQYCEMLWFRTFFRIVDLFVTVQGLFVGLFMIVFTGNAKCTLVTILFYFFNECLSENGFGEDLVIVCSHRSYLKK